MEMKLSNLLSRASFEAEDAIVPSSPVMPESAPSDCSVASWEEKTGTPVRWCAAELQEECDETVVQICAE